MEHHSSQTKNPLSLEVIQFSDIEDEFNSPRAFSKKHPIFHSRTIFEDPFLNSLEDTEITLINTLNDVLSFNQDHQIDRILEGERIRFIVKLCTSRPGGERITLVEKPIFSDSHNCKYFILKCYLAPEPTSVSFYLVRFVYCIGLYFFLDNNDKMLSFLKIALKNMKPSLWKINNLVIEPQDENHYSFDNTTHHSTCKFSQFSDGKRQQSTSGSKVGQKVSKNKIEGTKHTMLHHFTNIYSSHHKGRIISFINNQKSKGLFYKLSDLILLFDKINSNTLLLTEFQNEVLNENMKEKVQYCKKEYTSLISSIFSSGKRIQFINLRVILTQTYSSVMDSFDRQFHTFQWMQDYQIHLQILRGWIEKQEQNIFEINSILHETQTHKHIQNYMHVNLKKDISSTIELFFENNPNKRSNDANLDSLVVFLKGVYMQSVKKKIQLIQQNNRKRIIRQINYCQNPAEMLRNCQQRLNLCNDKKDYLIKCIDLVNMEIENLDNLQSGLALEQKRESILEQEMNPKKGKKEKKESFKSEHRNSNSIV